MKTKRPRVLSLAMDPEDQAAHLARLRLIMKPFPRIRDFDTHTRTARWAGVGLSFGSSARRGANDDDRNGQR